MNFSRVFNLIILLKEIKNVVDLFPKSNNNKMPITKTSSDRNSNKHIRPSNTDYDNFLTLPTTSNPNEEISIPELKAWFIEIAHSGT